MAVFVGFTNEDVTDETLEDCTAADFQTFYEELKPILEKYGKTKKILHY